MYNEAWASPLPCAAFAPTPSARRRIVMPQFYAALAAYGIAIAD
jgi:hypothetical protein